MSPTVFVVGDIVHVNNNRDPWIVVKFITTDLTGQILTLRSLVNRNMVVSTANVSVELAMYWHLDQARLQHWRRRLCRRAVEGMKGAQSITFKTTSGAAITAKVLDHTHATTTLIVRPLPDPTQRHPQKKRKR